MAKKLRKIMKWLPAYSQTQVKKARKASKTTPQGKKLRKWAAETLRRHKKNY